MIKNIIKTLFIAFITRENLSRITHFVSNFEALKSWLCQKEPFMKVWPGVDERKAAVRPGPGDNRYEGSRWLLL